MTTAQHTPIAVVGVSALFPGSANKTSFWRNILEERDLITDVPASHWLISDYYDGDPTARDKTYAKRGGFLPEIDFDAMHWGVPPTIMPATDTTQLLALVLAQRVIDDACRGQFGEALRDRTSCFLGVTSAQELLGTMVSRLQKPVWIKALREMGLPESQVQEACSRIADQYVEWQESSFPGVLGNVVAGRIANRLDLGGANCVTDAACASTFSAVSMGINELRLGTSDLVIAGGADTMNDIFMYMCFSKTPALSPSGDCRPFSDRADGTLLGEGIGMLALKRLADAERDGDRVYAVIKGVGASSDGRAKSVYAPVAEGQASALRRAYHQAQYSPASVGMVEAHGTGTKAGDAAEFEGLRLVFEEARADGGEAPWCALGSIKAQIGHTKAAAGAAGLFKAIMALHHRVLPATLKIDRPNPALSVQESPFYLNATTRPWIAAADAPRRASVSSFGFGGSNFHITVEEYRGEAPRPARLRSVGPELVLLSAATVESLVEACRQMASEADRPGMLAHLARTSQAAFDATAEHRLAIVAEDEAGLASKLENACTMVAAGKAFRSPTGVMFERGSADGAVGFVFPGQGSQYLGMGRDLALAFEEARAPWDAAAPRRCGGQALHDVVFPPAAFDDQARAAQRAALTATDRAQPAIGLTSLSMLRLLRAAGIEPAAVVGHSFGEVIALHAAGVIDEAGALSIACERGRLMAEAASEPGAMLSVRADLEAVEAQISDVEDVVVANHNGPRQVVLSGSTEAMATAEAQLKTAGLHTTRLQVATAFHSRIVAGAVAPFRAMLEDVAFEAPRTPVFSNREAAPYGDDAEVMRETLAKQLESRVRFVEAIEAMYERGVRTFVEVGPGHVLTGLVDRILADRPHRAIALDRKGRHGLASLWDALGQLACAGVAIDFDAFWREYGEAEAPPARSAMKMPVPLTGTSYGKVYPPAGGAAALPKPNPEAPAQPVTRAPEAPTVAARGEAAPQVLPRSAPVAPAVSSTDAPSWLAAFEIAQRQASEAQESFQRTLAASHERFMTASEASWNAVAALLANGAGIDETQVRALNDTVSRMAPRLDTAVEPARHEEASPTPPAPSREVEVPKVTSVAPTAPAVDLQTIVLDVVAEATGYPKEMLGLDMDLEADLGIDSIKRVEILSTLMQRAPDLPELPAAEVGKLATLEAILAALQDALGSDATPSAPEPSREVTTDLEGVVLAAVADKTGYPQEMLGLDMDLEADLGIDSIKRVEILAEIQKKVPNLPEMPAAEMSAQRTLGAIVSLIRAPGATGTATPPAPEVTRDVEAPAATPAPLRFAVPTPQRRAAPGVATPRLRGAKLLLVDDGEGVANALASMLSAHGETAVVPRDATIDGATAALIDLSGLCPRGDAEVESLAAFRRAKQIAPTVTAQGGLYVTVQDTGGDFGMSGHASPSGGMVALARTARHEWPAATVRALDVERGGRDAIDVARVIAHELLEGGLTPDVGLRANGERVEIVDLEPASEDATATCALGPSDVVLASGGARGVTAQSLIALAGSTGAAFALLGRSPLRDEDESTRTLEADADLKRALLESHRARGESLTPAQLGREVAALRASREVRSTLAAIEAAGAKADYFVADVTDVAAVTRVIEGCSRRWGAVTAIVHGAGVLADKRIADKDEEAFLRVLRTKVGGLEALLAACEDAPLKQLCVFSSVAARHGNAGQSDYAMANELVSQRAAAIAAQRPALRVKTLAWGPWRGGMVTPALARHFTSRGVALIEPDAGAAAFVNALQRGPKEPLSMLIGGDLPQPNRTRPTEPERVELCIDAERHTFLSDHRVRGAVVLPIAYVVELMARALGQALPDLHLVQLDGVRVLRGLRLDNFDDAPTWLSVEITELTNGEGATATVSLLDDAGGKRYTATAMLSQTRSRMPVASPAALRDAAPWSGSIYGGVLFHGSRFQVVDNVTALGADGSTAELEGAHIVDPAVHTRTDVGLIDGGLQLALRWTESALHGASLPTRVERIELHRNGPVAGRVTAQLRSRREETGGARATCDITMLDADGQPVLRLLGVETHLLPQTDAQVTTVAP